MKKELIAYYTDKWNCVWNLEYTELLNIQKTEDLISIIKEKYDFTLNSIFYIEDLEIYVDIDKDIKINYEDNKS